MVRAEDPDDSAMFGLTLMWQRRIEEYGRLVERDGRGAPDTCVAGYNLAREMARVDLAARKAKEAT